MSEPASITTGIAERYAQAIFDLARDENALPAVRDDATALQTAFGESEDLRRLIEAPVYERAEQAAAMNALGQKMGLADPTRNALRLMAQKGRLFAVPETLRQLREMIARHNGEISAEVTSARPLTDAQRDALAKTLGDAVGRDVNMTLSVDESLIGGLVVKVGSTMIDTSIKRQLAQLQTTMKEAS